MLLNPLRQYKPEKPVFFFLRRHPAHNKTNLEALLQQANTPHSIMNRLSTASVLGHRRSTCILRSSQTGGDHWCCASKRTKDEGRTTEISEVDSLRI